MPYIIRFSALLLFIVSVSANALQPTCKKYSFLSGGFNIDNYKTCRALIQKCPTNGVLPETVCVNRVIVNNKVCNQFRSLAKALEMPVSVITVRKKSNYRIVNVTYIADGQHQYYLISPKGCMINTKIDPREIDKALAEKYKDTKFLVVNWRQPIYKKTADGVTFLVPLRITDTCLACKVIGFATIKYKFDKKGNFLKASLDKFKSSPVKI